MGRRLEALRPLLPEIVCPTLILRGAESDVLPDEHAERFANALPDGRWLRIEDAGHTIQGHRPAELVRAIRAFVAEAVGGRWDGGSSWPKRSGGG